MQLDVRVPIGLLFTLLGLILVTYGLMEPEVHVARALPYNVNLYWGLGQAAFGLTMLYLARRGKRGSIN